MALDAVVFPQDPFGYTCCFKDYFQGMEGEIRCGILDGTNLSWSYERFGNFQEDQEEDKSLLNLLENKTGATLVNWLESSPVDSCLLRATNKDHWEHNTNDSSPEEFRGVYELPKEEDQQQKEEEELPPAMTTRRKRRRTKACKNKEEVENQRMTHIAVERNRRKQMNEYLAVLRSLMPSSYVQRGDQASIIGGAINFVKELEQLLQNLEAQKSTANHQKQDDPQQDSYANNNGRSTTALSPFASFFSFPQYSTTTATTTVDEDKGQTNIEGRYGVAASAADIEVTMVECHANVRILAKRCSRQLVKLVGAFQNLRLTVQHLNVSSHDQMALYSVSVKVEEGCKLNSVDEIAAAVNQMLRDIEDESSSSALS